MIVVADAILSVRIKASDSSPYLMQHKPLAEIREQDIKQNVKVFGRIVKLGNRRKERIDSIWDSEFHALMPLNCSNYFDRIVIARISSDTTVWQVKHFKNAFQREKVFFEKKTLDVLEVQQWFDKRDAVIVVAKKGRFWKEIPIIAIDNQFICTADGKLLYYKVIM